MNCLWFGGDNSALSTATTQYNYPTACFTSSWAAEAPRSTPVSESITITKLTVYLDTAPGTPASGKSYGFTVRDDGADTAATVTISDSGTQATWSGSVSIAANSLISLMAVPTGTPTAATNQWWQIEYSTSGQYFLMMGGSGQTASNSVTNYQNPCGGNGTTWSATVTDFEIVVPTDATATKMVVSADGTPGSGKSYATSLRLNDTSDNLTVTINDAETIDSATGSVDLIPGDVLVIKSVPSGTPTARRLGWCITIVPDVNGEMIYGFGNAAAPSTSSTNYEMLFSVGSAGWNSTESLRYMKPPAAAYKKLYVKLATAPASGKSRSFTLRDNGADTALTCTVSDANTTANDTTHTVTHGGGGNTGTFKTVPSGTPTATAGVHISYVMFKGQGSPGSQDAIFFGSNF